MSDVRLVQCEPKVPHAWALIYEPSNIFHCQYVRAMWSKDFDECIYVGDSPKKFTGLCNDLRVEVKVAALQEALRSVEAFGRVLLSPAIWQRLRSENLLKPNYRESSWCSPMGGLHEIVAYHFEDTLFEYKSPSDVVVDGETSRRGALSVLQVVPERMLYIDLA